LSNSYIGGSFTNLGRPSEFNEDKVHLPSKVKVLNQGVEEAGEESPTFKQGDESEIFMPSNNTTFDNNNMSYVREQ